MTTIHHIDPDPNLPDPNEPAYETTDHHGHRWEVRWTFNNKGTEGYLPFNLDTGKYMNGVQIETNAVKSRRARDRELAYRAKKAA